MSLELSLYKIETDLASLVSMRGDEEERIASIAEDWGDNPGIEAMGLLQSARENLQVIDTAIRAYITAEIRKADSIAELLLMLDRVAGPSKDRKDGKVICELDHEIERLRQRRDGLRARSEQIKGMVAEAMQQMEWKDGKPRKIEGLRHTLYLKSNGGKQALEVRDESLIPDEFCNITITMQAPLWRLIQKSNDFIPGLFSEKRVPVLDLIRAQLDAPCQSCKGTGGPFDLTAYGGGANEPCPDCAGSGKSSFPGVVLLDRGQHVEIK